MTSNPEDLLDLSDPVQVLALLERHSTTNLTARWEGSPDPQSHRNIRRVCRCGEVIGQDPYPVPKPGRTVRFSLGGNPFDASHREHLAQVLARVVEYGKGL